MSKTLKSLCILTFVLFALTPCKAKQSLLSVVDIEFSKSAHKNKTTISQCSFYKKQNTLAIEKHQQEIVPQLLDIPNIFSDSFSFDFFQEGNINSDFSTHQNQIPKYILYRQLALL